MFHYQLLGVEIPVGCVRTVVFLLYSVGKVLYYLVAVVIRCRLLRFVAKRCTDEIIRSLRVPTHLRRFLLSEGG